MVALVATGIQNTAAICIVAVMAGFEGHISETSL